MNPIHPDWNKKAPPPLRMAFIENIRRFAERYLPDSLMERKNKALIDKFSPSMLEAEKKSWSNPEIVSDFARAATDIHSANKDLVYLGVAESFLKNDILPPSSINLSAIKDANPDLFARAEAELSEFSSNKAGDGFSDRMAVALDRLSKPGDPTVPAAQRASAANMISVMARLNNEANRNSVNDYSTGYVPKFVKGIEANKNRK